MNEKHTPGPWVGGLVSDAIVSKAPTEASGIWRDSYNYYGGDLICESVAPKNKAIIQASPDMLQALEAVEWIEVDGCEGGVCPLCNADEGLKHRADCLIGNALKKAKGEV